jgi:hypothetical protein
MTNREAIKVLASLLESGLKGQGKHSLAEVAAHVKLELDK